MWIVSHSSKRLVNITNNPGVKINWDIQIIFFTLNRLTEALISLWTTIYNILKLIWMFVNVCCWDRTQHICSYKYSIFLALFARTNKKKRNRNCWWFLRNSSISEILPFHKLFLVLKNIKTSLWYVFQV